MFPPFVPCNKFPTVTASPTVLRAAHTPIIDVNRAVTGTGILQNTYIGVVDSPLLLGFHLHHNFYCSTNVTVSNGTNPFTKRKTNCSYRPALRGSHNTYERSHNWLLWKSARSRMFCMNLSATFVNEDRAR